MQASTGPAMLATISAGECSMAGRSSTARFLWRFSRPAQDVDHEREILVETSAGQRSATVFAPDGWPSRRPGWILLHGVTVPGRHHDALRRMARALAAAGHYAIAPEVDAWRHLRVDPGEAGPAVGAGVAGLAAATPANLDRVGVIGFSVAGRWAMSVAAADPERVRAVGAMGGYWDIERTLAAMISGEHDWSGERYLYDPDPYGRWIMGANLLPLLEGDAFGRAADRQAAAAALHQLAWTAGQNGAMARSPVYDPLNITLRESIPQACHRTWDLLAPLSFQPARTGDDARELASAMAAAAIRRYPLLASTDGLASLSQPVVLLHGRADRLIPFTESLRLAANLPPACLRRVTITRLFGHTRAREARPPRAPMARVRETRNFVATIGALLELLDDGQ